MKRNRTGSSRSKKRKVGACAAAGMALVLEIAPGCGSDKPPIAILPPRDAKADVVTGKDAGREVFFAIMPPKNDGATAKDVNIKPDSKRDSAIYAIMPPKNDGPPIYPIMPPKNDGMVISILPPPKLDGPPIYYILPPPKKDAGTIYPIMPPKNDGFIISILPPPPKKDGFIISILPPPKKGA